MGLLEWVCVVCGTVWCGFVGVTMCCVGHFGVGLRE